MHPPAWISACDANRIRARAAMYRFPSKDDLNFLIMQESKLRTRILTHPFRALSRRRKPILAFSSIVGDGCRNDCVCPSTDHHATDVQKRDHSPSYLPSIIEFNALCLLVVQFPSQSILRHGSLDWIFLRDVVFPFPLVALGIWYFFLPLPLRTNQLSTITRPSSVV